MADYESLDMSEMQSEYARVSSEGANVSSEDLIKKYVRLPEKDGYVTLRILPRKKGGKHYCATRVHTLRNPTTGRTRTYHCPKTLVQTANGKRWQGDCFICKYYSDLWQKSEGMSGKAQEDLQNQARAIKPVERYYYNVIVRVEKDPKTGDSLKNVGPKIYSCGKTVHEKICRAIVGDETAGEKALGDITHPMNGRDFKVVKKVVKSGGNEYPNYDNSKFEDISPAGSPEELSNWIENLHDLQALRVIKTEEELKQALRVHLGMVKEGEDQDDNDLAEFRNASGLGKPAEPVREELLSTPQATATPTVTTTTSKPEEDYMADDDFMKQLEDAM